MPPATLDTFLSNLAKSNLLNEEQLTLIQADAASAGDALHPKQLAQKLFKDGLLTRWQAGMLLAGRSAFFLGKYKLLQELGRGGMGAVFKAEQQPLGRIVAIKVMSANLVKDKTAVARFHREIQAAAALQHPNIVAAIDADHVQNTHFLVMEFVEGEDLSDIAKREGKLPIGTACEYIRQAAMGLQHAHERGMAHRDIKPANLLLTWRSPTEPLVKILDMGLARFTSEQNEDGGLTQTGQIMGTPDYIAPEQAKDTKHADIRSDIFSLGCSLFRLLTGQLPFKGNNVMEKLMARATDDAPPLRSVLSEVPVELEAVVAKMLARNPDERYQTPAELANVLTPFSATPDSSSAGQPQPVEPAALPQTSSVSMPVDAGMGQFLQDLSNEADEDLAPAQTMQSISDTDLSGGRQDPGTLTSDAQSSGGASIVMTRGGVKLQQQLEQRKVADRKRLMLILAGVAACVALIAGVVVWQKLGETTLIIDWPVDERQGAKLEVDGRTIKVGKKTQLSFPGSPGEQTIELRRKGYRSIKEKLTFSRGETQTFQPTWKPTSSTVRAKEWKRLKSEFATTFSGFSGKRPSSTDESVVQIGQKLQSFVKKWPINSESVQARSLLIRLPGPFDELVAENLPETDPPLDKTVPLVKVLGAKDLRLAHWGQVRSVAFTPDDKFLISSDRGTIRFWDTKEGRLHKSFSQRSFRIAVSPDGKTLAATHDGVHLWDLTNFKKLPNRLKHKGTLYSLAFSPDGKILATVSSYGTTKLWETSSWQELRTLPGTVRLDHVAFSPDGKLLATGGNEKVVKIWDVETGELKITFKGHQGLIAGIAFSTDGQQLVSSAHGDRTILWDLKNEREIATTNGVGRLQFSQDGSSLAAFVYNTTVVLDPKTLKQRHAIRHGGICLGISHDNRLIATGSAEGTVRLWDLNTGDSVIDVPEPSGVVTKLSVSSNGRLIAAGDFDGHIRIYEVPSGKETHDISAHSHYVTGLEFSPGGQQLLSVDVVGFASLWNAVTGERIRSCPEKTINGVAAFSPDGTMAAIGGQEGNVILWELETGAVLKTLDQGSGLQSLVFSPDGKLLASGSGDHVVKLWNIETGEEAREPWKVEYYVYSLAFTPDGKTLIAASSTIWFWDINSGTRTKTIHRAVASLAFSPDGKLLATTTGSPPNKVTVFDTKTTQVMQEFTLVSPGGRITKVVFTPDGRHLVTANGNGTIYVLRLEEWSAEDGE